MFNRQNLSNILNGIWILFICFICFCIGWFANARISSKPNLVSVAQKMILNESHYNEQTDTELSYAAIRGMLSVINDPYAELIEPEAARDLISTFAGYTGVVGLYAENQNDHAVITKVFPDSAAKSEGVEVGDKILSINNVAVDSEADSSEIGLLLRGVPGTEVKLEIMRDGQVLDLFLERREQEFLTYRMLPEKIGYISLMAFNENSSQKMKQALVELIEQKPIGLILDLRNNEGGDMFAAQEILGYLIEDGLLFTAELSGGRKVEFYAKGDAFAKDTRLRQILREYDYKSYVAEAWVAKERFITALDEQCYSLFPTSK